MRYQNGVLLGLKELQVFAGRNRRGVKHRRATESMLKKMSRHCAGNASGMGGMTWSERRLCQE